MKRLKAWATALKRDVITLWFVVKHPQTPGLVRALVAVLTAYALSPVDLIPDFIPILGYLDDLLIVPIGVWLLLKIIPAPVLADCRRLAEEWFLQNTKKPSSRIGWVLIVGLWAGAAWISFKLWVA